MDAMQRVHQCATVQLGFQLPLRFDLKYKAGEGLGDGSGDGFAKPIIIHRAMLGSVERMTAILIEHYGGKWPFWLSPRQCLVVPVKDTCNAYAQEVCAKVHDAGFFAEVDLSGNTMQKKVRDGQLAQFNFILVVGDKEAADGTVNVRLRNNTVAGTKPLAELLALFRDQTDHFTAPEGEDEAAEKAAASLAAKADKAAAGGDKGQAPKEGKEKGGPPKAGSKEAKALANKPSPEEIERRKVEAVAAKALKEAAKAEKAAAAGK